MDDKLEQRQKALVVFCQKDEIFLCDWEYSQKGLPSTRHMCNMARKGLRTVCTAVLFGNERKIPYGRFHSGGMSQFFLKRQRNREIVKWIYLAVVTISGPYSCWR
jgi:hypothetical protein